MADEHDTSTDAHDQDAGGKKRLSGKKLLFIILPLIILIGGGAGLHFSGKLDSLLGKKDKAKVEKKQDDSHEEGDDHAAATGPGFYYDLPDLIINLNDQNNKQRFLKLSISLEIPTAEDKPKLEAVMPRITDQFQTYLRELRVEDLRGSAGIYRLRQELLSRVRSAAGSVKVRDVLFREILVQ